MPYRCRESIYFEDMNYRDLVFKGYVVVYKIQKDLVLIYDIVKNRLIK